MQNHASSERAVGRVSAVMRPFSYSEASRDLVLRAVARARDPQYAEVFPVIVAHHDPQAVPIAATVAMLEEAGRPLSLRWTAEQWRAKHAQLEAERELSEQASDYTRRAPWLRRFLASGRWDRGRVQPVTTPQRLVREGLRQRISIRNLARRIERGTLACFSVVTGGKRWTVVLRPALGWRRAPRIRSVFGRDGVEASPEIEHTVAGLLSLPEPRRKRAPPWPGWGELVLLGLGLLVARAVASFEPAAPRIPEHLLAGGGIACFAACRYLARPATGSGWGARALLVLTCFAPAGLGIGAFGVPVPVDFSDLVEQKGWAAQLMLVPMSFLVAAFLWPIAARTYRRCSCLGVRRRDGACR